MWNTHQKPEIDREPLHSARKYRSTKMPKANKKVQCEPHTSDTVPPEEETNFEQGSESEQEVFTRQHQTPTTTYVPYIEGPKMNWTVDDGLYNWFLKWKIKCENILDCELDMLSDAWKCKKVVAWSGDFGIDQVISWDLSPKETTLEVIWQKKFERVL